MSTPSGATRGVGQNKGSSTDDGRMRQITNESDLMTTIDIKLFLQLLVMVDHVK